MKKLRFTWALSGMMVFRGLVRLKWLTKARAVCRSMERMTVPWLFSSLVRNIRILLLSTVLCRFR